MNRALLHRGPDQAGVHVDPEWRVGLAVRRLSIVDPENGLQPMFSEDRSIAVVCNGEIYNHRELRRELERKGYRLRSHSDGEVISHLYLEEGVGFLKRLNGMFALAVLDRRDGSLLLARDPVGMKHLYWSETPRGFAFSSEARALFAAGLLTPAPDWASLSTFFSTGWVQSPRSAFENLQRLRPGSFLRISPKGCEEGRYWVPRYQRAGEERGLEDWSAELREILDRAVGTHLDTDVPAGLFLSGGWDSSLVSLYASRQSAEPLNSYSLAFPDDPGVDESAYAEQVADLAGTRGHRIELRDADIRDVLLQTSRALEEPVVTCPTALGFLLSRAASRDRKVVLGGEGADEIFAGYGRFEFSPLHRV
jgi:asparagine synthase (glutamine-hydrolysing)